jgi:SsrA-binding protein
MAKPLPQPFDKQKVVAENRRARFDYFIEERFEAGIQLTGTEVKSLRQGEGSIAESYATAEGDEIWLINSHIPEYSHGNRLNHEPRRQRKLLLKGREIAKLHGAVTRQGLTLVPLSMYFNGNGTGQEGARQAGHDEGARLEAGAAAAAQEQWLRPPCRSSAG